LRSSCASPPDPFPDLRLVFAGTPPFAERALSRLLAAGHEVALVLTQPDRPAGRGQKAAFSAVKQLALSRGLEVLQPVTLRSAPVLERLRAANPRAMVVAAYGLILPEPLLSLGPLGAINIHASLLPRWRGAAPIQRALLAGDSRTGVSIMQMDAGLDSGPVLAQRVVPIGPQDDAGTLHDKLADAGADAMVETLGQLERGEARAVPQPEAGVTYAAKIDKGELWIDWRRPATELERKIRAFRPSPGAATRLGEAPLKLWQARVVRESGEPGMVLDAGDVLLVACGEQALAIEEVQRAGGRRMSAADFLRGQHVGRGVRLG
jgi:methionyl-tRNA formyltransferase